MLLLLLLWILGFANELKTFVVGRNSEATFADTFQKQEAIIRYLGRFDPIGDVSFSIFNPIYLFFFQDYFTGFSPMGKLNCCYWGNTFFE